MNRNKLSTTPVTFYLLSHSYLNDTGTRQVCSGLQRYVRELSRLISAQGLRCVVLQKSNVHFDRPLPDGTRVIGVPSSPSAWGDPGFNYRAHKLIPPDAPVIYCVLELSYPRLRARSVAVQHGVWWDGEYSRWKYEFIRWVNARVMHTAQAVICVDTNYINWALTALPHYDRTCSKCHYIPNFVDTTLFAAAARQHPNGNGARPTILFPRRCEGKRGAGLFLDAALALWKRGVKFRAVFCGWGSLQEYIGATLQGTSYEGSIEVCDVGFDEMPRVYQEADIVVVPTVRHEGTSLSCIEAMACGKPVITTYIGGLPNLIIPGVNGEVIAPQVGPLADAILKLLNDNALREKYSAAGAVTAQELALTRWQDSAWKVIAGTLL